MKRHFGIFLSLTLVQTLVAGVSLEISFYERWKGDVFFLPTRIDRATTIEHINFFLLLLWKPHIRPGATEIWVCARLFLLSHSHWVVMWSQNMDPWLLCLSTYLKINLKSENGVLSFLENFHSFWIRRFFKILMGWLRGKKFVQVLWEDFCE
jgi:hypothetical protein